MLTQARPTSTVIKKTLLYDGDIKFFYYYISLLHFGYLSLLR